MNSKQGQSRWFRASVGVLTLVSGIALFTVSGLGIHSIASVLVAFLCLLGLERLYSGLLGIVIVLLQARRAKANRDAS
jgi:uncharacterized membrane protein YczE